MGKKKKIEKKKVVIIMDEFHMVHMEEFKKKGIDMVGKYEDLMKTFKDLKEEN